MSGRGPDNTLPPVTADDYFAAVREVEAAERHMQDTERSHQPNSPTLLSADGALERAREKVAALEDRTARQSGLQPHEAAAGVHFGADGTAYMVKERIAAETEAAYTERDALRAGSGRQMPWFRDDYRDQMEERALPSAELEVLLDRLAAQEVSWEAPAQSDVDGRAR